MHLNTHKTWWKVLYFDSLTHLQISPLSSYSLPLAWLPMCELPKAKWKPILSPLILQDPLPMLVINMFDNTNKQNSIGHKSMHGRTICLPSNPSSTTDSATLACYLIPLDLNFIWKKNGDNDWIYLIVFPWGWSEII